MILTGNKIISCVKNKEITISPFNYCQVNPNSYNFRLGEVLKIYDKFPLDSKTINSFREIIIPDEGYLLKPNSLYLASTVEVMGSTRYVPTFSARSSIARLGLLINLSADLGDVGYIGQWTLQLLTIHPLRIYKGMKIGQIMWWKPEGEISLYDGKYQGSIGPQSTQIYKDFQEEDNLSEFYSNS